MEEKTYKFKGDCGAIAELKFGACCDSIKTMCPICDMPHEFIKVKKEKFAQG